MIHNTIPEGYKIEWRIDPDFCLAGLGYLCSYKGCRDTAIAVLFRKAHLANGSMVNRHQYCCINHMYGREIRDGQVMADCLVEEGRKES